MGVSGCWEGGEREGEKKGERRVSGWCEREKGEGKRGVFGMDRLIQVVFVSNFHGTDNSALLFCTNFHNKK